MNKKSEDLFKACICGKLDMVKKLLDEGVDINIRDKYKWTPLMDAAIFDHLDVVNYLILRGVDINATEECNMSPLILVARNRRSTRIFRKLLDCGANYNIVDDEGKKMIDYLEEHKKEEIEEYIFNLSCDVKPAR